MEKSVIEENIQEKKKEIQKLFKSLSPPAWLELCQIMSDAWLEDEYSMEEIEEDILNSFRVIKNDIDLLCSVWKFDKDALDAYKGTLNFAYAMGVGERNRIEKMNKTEGRHPTKEEMAAAAAEAKQIEDPRYKVRIEINVTMAQARELRAWLDAHQIEARQV